MGDLRRHLAHRGQLLGAAQALLTLGERRRHRVELAAERPDLVGRVGGDALAVVAAHAPRALSHSWRSGRSVACTSHRTRMPQAVADSASTAVIATARVSRRS